MYTVFEKRGKAALVQAQAITELVKAIGAREGILEAVREGIISEEVDIASVIAHHATMVPEAKAAFYGQRTVPPTGTFTEEEIQEALKLWNEYFVEKDLLNAIPSNPLR